MQKQIFDIVWENGKQVVGKINLSTLDKESQIVDVNWSDGKTTSEYISEKEVRKLLDGKDLI